MRKRNSAGVVAVLVVAATTLWGLDLMPSALDAGSARDGDSVVTDREPASAMAASTRRRGVSALGRLEPEDGILRISGPSTQVVVVRELLVEDGDIVEAGQTLATLDALPLFEADVAQLEAELGYERAELRRRRELHQSRVVSEAAREAAETRVRVVAAKLRRARAEVERHRVRAPFAGQVLRIHTRPGERVYQDGILEFGRTDAMVAIAEVYETDIDRVVVGQRASIASPALAEPLTGRVARIWPQVAKQDVLGTDPAAREDARIVEVQIRLDDSEAAARLSHLQVTVEIDADSDLEIAASDLETTGSGLEMPGMP